MPYDLEADREPVRPGGVRSGVSGPVSGKRLAILGTRGIPAAHSGFETLAEFLGPYLVERGWRVDVYCQDEGAGGPEIWKGVRLHHVRVGMKGSPGSIIFDFKSTLRAARTNQLILTLGYNTAVFCLLYRLRGHYNVMNMDGLEWKRAKWSWLVKAWYYANEWIGSRIANHLIGDHPEIVEHLARRAARAKTTMIPYGANRLDDGDRNVLSRFELRPDGYVIIVCRAEPENSVLEMVSAFSRRRRGLKLVVVGRYDFARQSYHRRVRNAASDEVQFVGGIYDPSVLPNLRYFARLYMHGHQVGGTNPTLVEAMGAGNAVLARDNKYNRWVAGPDASYFRNEEECAMRLDDLLDDAGALRRLREASLRRHEERFRWETILREYEELLERCVYASG